MTGDFTFSLNIIADLEQMLHYPFMQHAFEGGAIVSVIAGIIGYFVVLRRSSFAAHALSHVGFAGGAGAALLTSFVDPSLAPVVVLSGLLLFTNAGGVAIAALAPRAAQRDVQIGIVLAFMLGLGLLFISLYSGSSIGVVSLLFGQITGISSPWVLVAFAVGLFVLVVLAVVYRPLLFASLDEDVAEAKGLPVLFLGIVFMNMVAIATSISVQIVGVLLIFALMVTPAAIAQQLSKRPRQAMAISVAVALTATWLGLFISWYEPYPPSFLITSIVFVLYLIVRFAHPQLERIEFKQTPSDS